MLAVQTSREVLQRLMRPGVSLSDTPIELERLGVVASLLGSSTSEAVRKKGRIAYDLTQLAACVRAFSRCEKKSRGVASQAYECESGESTLLG